MTRPVSCVPVVIEIISLSNEFIRRKSLEFIRRNDSVTICSLQVKTVETVDLPDSVVEIVVLQVNTVIF